MTLRKLLLFALLSLSLPIAAQKVGLKTNLLYDATLTPNLTAEVGIGAKHTAQLSYALNPWTFAEGRKYRHWMLSPEWRHWFCSKFNGHFLGLYANGGEFNVENARLPGSMFPHVRHRHYEGWFAGAGVSYGYQWILSKHWNLEASLGVGYDHIRYKESLCGHCARPYGTHHKNYVGLQKLNLSVVYLF